MTSRSSHDTYIVMEFAIIFVGVFLVFQIILFEHGEQEQSCTLFDQI